MKLIRKMVFPGLLLLLISSANGQTVSLEQLLDTVKIRHPLIQQQELNPEIEKVRRSRIKSTDSWYIAGGPSFFYSKPIQTSSFSPDRIEEYSLSANMERSLWSTGGDLSLGFSSSLTEQKIPVFTVPGPDGTTSFSPGSNRIFENRLSISYLQPLMRNRGGTLDRLDYDLSEYQVDISTVQSIESQEKFILDIANRYIEWALLTEQIEIAEERLQLAEEQLDLSREKRESNLVDQVDVLRAEDAVRSARQSQVLLETQLKAKKAELAVLSEWPAIFDATPTFDLHQMVNLPSPEESYEENKEHFRTLKALDIQMQRLKNLRLGYKEQSRPGLDLNLGLDMKGGDDDFGSSLEITRPDFRIGLNFYQQLGANTAESDIKIVDLQTKQMEFQYEQTALEIKSSLYNLLIQIKEMENVLALNREQIESARQKTEEELRLYNQGRGQLTFVIQSRDNIQNARLAYAENAANYHRLVLRYRELADQLLKVKM